MNNLVLRNGLYPFILISDLNLEWLLASGTKSPVYDNSYFSEIRFLHHNYSRLGRVHAATWRTLEWRNSGNTSDRHCSRHTGGNSLKSLIRRCQPGWNWFEPSGLRRDKSHCVNQASIEWWVAGRGSRV